MGFHVSGDREKIRLASSGRERAEISCKGGGVLGMRKRRVHGYLLQVRK